MCSLTIQTVDVNPWPKTFCGLKFCILNMAFNYLRDPTPPCFPSFVLFSLSFLARLALRQQHANLFPVFGPWQMYFSLLGTLSHLPFSPSPGPLLVNLKIQLRLDFLHRVFPITPATRDHLLEASTKCTL